MGPRPQVVTLLVAFLCLIWGSTWLVIREGLADLPPLTSAAVRFACAFTVMCVLAPLLARREGGQRPPAWLWLTLGLTNFAASFGIVYTCETVLPSGLVSVLWAVFPLLVAAGGHCFLPGERLGPRQAAGFVLGFAGVGLLYLTDVSALGPAAVPMALLLLVSPIVSAAGNIVIKRYGAGVSSVCLNRNAMGVGAAVLGVLAFGLEREASIHWTPRALFSIGYLSLVGTCVTFSIYFWLLRNTRASRLSLIAFVTPCIALLLGWGFADEPVTIYTLAGTATVVLGICLVVLRGRAAGLQPAPRAAASALSDRGEGDVERRAAAVGAQHQEPGAPPHRGEVHQEQR